MNERATASPGPAASGSWWLENLLRPVIIAAMMLCLAAPITGFVEWMLVGWDRTYFLVFLFFVCLEGIFSERLLRSQRVAGYNYLASRAAELVFLWVLMKLVNYLPLGFDQLLFEARMWPDEIDLLVNNVDLLTGAIMVPLWAGAFGIARQVMELDVEEAQAAPPPDRTSTEYYLWLTQPPVVREREEALNWLAESFLWGGVLLLIVSMVSFFLLPGRDVPALPTLLYFALGVALLSQARFSVSHTGWLVQGIQVQPAIGRRWLLWAVIFFVGVSSLALLLPTGYALGPLRALFSAVSLVMQVFTYVIAFLFYLLALLLSPLFSPQERPERPPLTLEPPSPSQAAPVAGGVPWLEVLVSALFWIVLVSIVGYAVYRFLRDRLGLLALDGEAVQGGSWWQRLLLWLRQLWRGWGALRQEVGERLARRRAEREEKPSLSRRLTRFFSLRGLSPRDLVRYFYLSTERRADKAGQPRRPGQTPYEYRAALDETFPDLEPDLTGLTEAFVEARYSQQPIEKEDAEAVKPLWQRIKAALRRKVVGGRL